MGEAPHERLEIYRTSLEAARSLREIARGLDREEEDLRDQLQRAATSVVLNLAEGAGEYRPAEKARFYRMSRRSAAECLAVLDLIAVYGLDAGNREPSRGMLRQIMATLTRLIHAVESRAQPQPQRQP